MRTTLPADIKMNGHYTKKSTADLLGIGRSTLDRHIAEGNIRVRMHRYTTRVTITGREIIRFFNAES